MTMGRRRYRDGRRRLLVDMHIPDWDQGFLGRYDPRGLAEEAVAAGAESVMLYFQSHLGLCYYPTVVGRCHKAMGEADWAGAALAAFSERDVPVCAYYSVNFNNQAWLDHPEWRLQPAAPATVGILPRERYGIVCLNQPGYRAFVELQIAEIAAYPVDAFFFDMVWWNGVCICPACEARCKAETGHAIPRLVDWESVEWTGFQRARERWLTEFACWLRDRARSCRPGADVYHNFALGLSNWTRGVSFDSVAGHDFLGGDFYGGRAEQLLITRLMLNLTPSRPAEFMTTAAANLTEHTRLRPEGQIVTKALAAAAADAAFLAIVAIDPDGALDREAMSRVQTAFEANSAVDGLLGGDPIEAVALYCSDTSKANVWDGSRPISDAPASSLPDYPHFAALAGAARSLQEGHIPFGVATRANLQELSRWPVIVLPNAERLSDAEIGAFSSYVEHGGRIYASRGTSLWDPEGGRRSDFGLGDLFGCRFEGAEGGRLVYAEAAALREPGRPLAHWLDAGGKTGCVRVDTVDADTLVALTLPYGHPHKGAVGDRHWASIHSSPPWERTTRPMVTERTHGFGRVIYSAADLEAGDSPEHRALFATLIERLLEGTAKVAAEVHPQVWLSAYEEPDRLVIMLLNYPLEEPPLPVPGARLRLLLPPGRQCRGAWLGASREPLEHRQDGNEVVVECSAFERLAVIVVDHG